MLGQMQLRGFIRLGKRGYTCAVVIMTRIMIMIVIVIGAACPMTKVNRIGLGLQ